MRNRGKLHTSIKRKNLNKTTSRTLWLSIHTNPKFVWFRLWIFWCANLSRFRQKNSTLTSVKWICATAQSKVNFYRFIYSFLCFFFHDFVPFPLSKLWFSSDWLCIQPPPPQTTSHPTKWHKIHKIKVRDSSWHYRNLR